MNGGSGRQVVPLHLEGADPEFLHPVVKASPREDVEYGPEMLLLWVGAVEVSIRCVLELGHKLRDTYAESWWVRSLGAPKSQRPEFVFRIYLKLAVIQ